jgi:hypothetical protein
MVCVGEGLSTVDMSHSLQMPKVAYGLDISFVSLSSFSVGLCSMLV